MRQYAAAELAAGRFPSIAINNVVGTWMVYDGEWVRLKESFPNKFSAEVARSKAIDLAARDADKLSRP